MNKQTTLIKELKHEEEWKYAFPVMQQLRPQLDEERYLTLVKEAVQKQDYKLMATFENGEVVAVIGFMPMVTLYNGRGVWICDLVTDSKERSYGHGNALLTFIENWSKERGYERVSLSSGFQRIDAHRFYETKMCYDKTSYVFLKKL